MKKIVPVDAVLIPENASCAYQGEIFAVYQWPQELYDGSVATFEMLRRPDTVCALCIVDDKLIVLDEEQPNSGRRRSFPGGRVESTDVDIVSAAKREVLEETGYSFAHWRLVKVVQPVSKMEWFVYYAVAWDADGQAETAHDSGEKITQEMLHFSEMKSLVNESAGFLGETADLFEHIDTLAQLKDLPEYTGKLYEAHAA